MNRQKLHLDIVTPKHYLELRTFELNKVLLWWQTKGHVDLNPFKWLKTVSVGSMAKFCRVVNKHYFTPAEVRDLTNWKEDKKLMFVAYDVYFDIVQCYMYLDKKRIEIDKEDIRKRKIRLRELVNKYDEHIPERKKR